MFAVCQEDDKVIIDLMGRRFDLLITCEQAEKMEQSLRDAANLAETAPASLIKGEQWNLKCESFDGMVALKFFPPHVGAPSRVPLTPVAARAVADAVKFKREQAEHKLRLVFQNLRS